MTYVKCAHHDGDGDGGVRPPHARQRHRPLVTKEEVSK